MRRQRWSAAASKFPMIELIPHPKRQITQSDEQDGRRKNNLFFVLLPDFFVEAEAGAFPDARCHEARCIRKGIGKEISHQRWAGGRQQTQAAFDGASTVVRVDDIDGALLVVSVAFLAVIYDDIPAQVIAKNPCPHAKHLFEQISMLFRVMRFNNDDHN